MFDAIHRSREKRPCSLSQASVRYWKSGGSQTRCTPTGHSLSFRDMKLLMLAALLSGVFAAPFMKEEEAKRFMRVKRQSGYWDPHHSQNQWGYTVQEQANEYWTALRTDAQYYMDMSALMFDRSVATENNKLYMEMLRNARAHLDSQTGRQR